MSLESRHLLIDDLKIYSEGLVNALKQDKLREAKEYERSLRNAIDDTSGHLDSHLSLENDAQQDPDASSLDTVSTEADRAVAAASVEQQTNNNEREAALID